MWNPLAKYMTISRGIELANATAKRAASIDDSLIKIIDRLEGVEREVRTLKQEAAALYCSFCAKSQHEVAKLIAGPKGIYICNECIKLCTDIVLDGRAVDKSNNGENSP